MLKELFPTIGVLVSPSDVIEWLRRNHPELLP